MQNAKRHLKIMVASRELELQVKPLYISSPSIMKTDLHYNYIYTQVSAQANFLAEARTK